MATHPVRVADTDEAKVIRWRRRQLLDAGYSPSVAKTIAERVDVDLHEAVRLVREGCRPDVAALILL